MNVSETDFCLCVEEEAKDCDSYIHAVIKSCEAFNIDVKFGAKLISKPIIEKIQQEGEDSNLLPKISKLPI